MSPDSITMRLGDWAVVVGTLVALITLTVVTLTTMVIAHRRLVVMEVATTTRLNEIHTLVNSRLSEALKKIDRLEWALHEATGEEPSGEPEAVRPDT